MKKLLTGILSLTLAAAMTVPVFAADSSLLIAPALGASPAAAEETAAIGYAVEIDGRDSGIRGRVMVPLRAVAEALGFTVAWDNGVITLTGPERYAELTIGVDQYFAAPTQEGMMGASLFSLDCAPVLMNDTAYVPVELFDTLLGCKEGTVALEENTVKISTEPQNAAQRPNPFADHESLADAAKAAGFSMSVPDALEGYSRRLIQTMDDEMIQVIYQNEDSSVFIRKAAGSGDISGDYNQYAQSKIVDVNGSSVTMRGADGLVMTAIWERGGYTYAVTASAGMSRAAMTALIQAVR